MICWDFVCAFLVAWRDGAACVESGGCGVVCCRWLLFGCLPGGFLPLCQYLIFCILKAETSDRKIKIVTSIRGTSIWWRTRRSQLSIQPLCCERLQQNGKQSLAHSKLHKIADV